MVRGRGCDAQAETEEREDSDRHFAPSGAAVVTSDLSAGSLAASAEPATLTQVPDLPPIGLADGGDGRIAPESTSGPSAAPPAASVRRPGGRLRARLLALDIPAVVATWVVVGTLGTPGVTMSRRLVAVGAAILVTLAAMPLLGLYRSRLCVQRRRETSRIAVACIAGALTFGLIKGDPLGADDAVIVAAGSCILALMTLRWSFGQWLSAQRMRGRYRRGIVMVGTDEDAVDVWRMLHSQPELGYEVRGIIGEPRFCPEWAELPNDRTIDGLLDIAIKTESTGVLVVVNALSVAEIRDVITAEHDSWSARTDLSGVSGVGNPQGPPCTGQWRGLSVRGTGTACDLAVGCKTCDRRDRSRSRGAGRRSDPPAGMGRHPDR